MTRRPRTRTAVVLAVVAALLAGAGGTAYAVAQARATGEQSVSTASFGAQPSTSATSSSQAGPLVLLYEGNDRAARLVYLRNTGDLALTGQGWSLSIANTAGGVRGDASLLTCSTGYTATGACSGAESVFLTGTETSATTPVTATTSFPVAVNGVHVVKFVPNQIKGYSATIATTVSRSQVRAVSTTSS